MRHDDDFSGVHLPWSLFLAPILRHLHQHPLQDFENLLLADFLVLPGRLYFCVWCHFLTRILLPPTRKRFDLARQRKKNRSAEPRPLLKPRPRGTNEQHLADAPFRERGPSTASLVQEPRGSGWSVLRKQKLDARASFSFFRE